ncbi:MAG: hypothetical protein E3J72_06030 [Planctomycetota bacterium]|nr:MAG: hypothetical protein E3J72_06030 [Planctomycetota bacterium]
MNRTTERHGSLLIDFVAATTIFLLVTGAFYALCRTKDQAVDDAEKIAHATNAAQARLETLVRMDYETLLKQDGSKFPASVLEEKIEETGVVSVKEFEPGLAQVTVIVRWGLRAGGQDEVKFSTLVRGKEGWR